jgi:hypothetical protein
MHTQQLILLGIIIVGGVSVIGSYIYGFRTHPNSVNSLWGGTPKTLRLINLPFMILAAIGFIAFSYFILFHLNPEEVQIANSLGFYLFYIIFALILIPSAFWMPLTFAMIARPKTSLWIGIRLTLAIVGISSIALLIVLLYLNINEPGLLYWFAVGGAVAFSIQTVLFDVFLWPIFFLPSLGE